jgi:outer membrane protein assembly factor BamE (lipoprotein component of BamABCDE complex)
MHSLSKTMAGALMGCALLLAAACTPTVDHRGYLAKPGSFDQIQNGMSKEQVEGILGSPSTTASINYQGDSYYYISSVTEQKAFLKPKELSREVIVIRFDQNDQVSSFAQYGLEDGRIIDLNTRETPTKGREYTFLQQFFGSVGKPGGTAVRPTSPTAGPGSGGGF